MGKSITFVLVCLGCVGLGYVLFSTPQDAPLVLDVLFVASVLAAVGLLIAIISPEMRRSVHKKQTQRRARRQAMNDRGRSESEPRSETLP